MNDLENTADPSWTTVNSAIPLCVSLNFNQAGHSINDVILIPLDSIRSNRNAVRKASEAHLIHKENTLSTREINRRDEAHWYKIPPSLLHQLQPIVFIVIFFFICKEILVSSSFFCYPEEGLFSNRNIGQICLDIYMFCLLPQRLQLAVRISLPFHIFAFLRYLSVTALEQPPQIVYTRVACSPAPGEKPSGHV